MVTSPAVQARSLYRFYRAGEEETPALQGVSLSVPPGQLVAVIGRRDRASRPLLACLAGMDDPDGGVVRVAGQRISHRRDRMRVLIRARQVGMMFPGANLMEHLTGRQNVALVRSRTSRSAHGPALLSSLGL
ncbi:hypothetical protein JCM12141A_57790 [Mycolicibacterium hodleri]